MVHECKFKVMSWCLIGLVGATSVACTTPSMHLDYNTDAAYDAEGFAWLDGLPDRPELEGTVELFLQTRLQEILRNKNLEQSELHPDLFIAYYVGQGTAIDLESQPYAYWPPQWARGGFPEGAEAYEFPRGSLIIDLIDRPSMTLLWRGSKKGVFKGSTERQLEKLALALEELLENYPPPALFPRQ